jgi:hypothetical protein
MVCLSEGYGSLCKKADEILKLSGSTQGLRKAGMCLYVTSAPTRVNAIRRWAVCWILVACQGGWLILEYLRDDLALARDKS